MNDRFEVAERRATVAIMRDTFAHLPDPARYAHVLPEDVAKALSSAWTSPAGRRVSAEDAVKLRPYGLCEFGGTHLTVFGTSVRNMLLEGMLA